MLQKQQQRLRNFWRCGIDSSAGCCVGLCGGTHDIATIYTQYVYIYGVTSTVEVDEIPSGFKPTNGEGMCALMNTPTAAFMVESLQFL